MNAQILSNEDAAKLLHVSMRTLSRYRSDGLIAYSQVGRKVFFTLDNIAEFIETYKKETFINQKSKNKWRP